jgi:transposase
MKNYSVNDAINILYKCGITKVPTMQKHLKRGKFKISDRNLWRKMATLSKKKEIEDHRKAASGRAPALTPRDQERIIDLLKKEPLYNTAEIKANLKLVCAVRTIGRFLKEAGYKYMRIKETPRLNDEDKGDRVKFARRHKGDDWRQTFFLDESTFRLGSHRARAYQRSNQRLSVPVDKVPSKINVVGMISSRGGSRLICFQENLNANLFVSFLKDLKKDADKLYPRRNYRLCMDRDPKHTAKVTREYMKSAKISYLEEWPQRSPDLNPIENLWGLVEKELKKLHITNTYHLKAALRSIWIRLTRSERMEHLINDMSKRMTEVIASKGCKIRR